MPVSTELARTVVRAVRTEFPYATMHVTASAADLRTDPRELHPAFRGSFDWHSSVHMQYSGLRLLDDDLNDDARADLLALLDERLTADAIEREIAYLRANPHFERPYGWAWAAQLAAYAARSPVAAERGWAAAVAPLGLHVLGRFDQWLPSLAYPVRHGEHSSTAFALLLARDAAGRLGRTSTATLIDERAIAWYGGDRDAPVDYEPSGSDFLSPSLCEAALMQQVLPAEQFRGWLGGFLPRLGDADDPLLRPTVVLDETDGKAVHLHGLALSRAWLLRSLSAGLDDDASARIAAATGDAVAVAAEAAVGGHFMSTHWLVTFVLLAERGLG